MEEKEKEDKTGFPDDSYTSNFIKGQENLYNFDYKPAYQFDSKTRKPKALAILNFILSVIGGLGFLYGAYDGITSWLKGKDVVGNIFITLISTGTCILLFLVARSSLKVIRKKKSHK